MTDAPLSSPHDHVFLGADHKRNERRTWLVITITATMMVVEIAAGTLYGSMAIATPIRRIPTSKTITTRTAVTKSRLWPIATDVTILDRANMPDPSSFRRSELVSSLRPASKP